MDERVSSSLSSPLGAVIEFAMLPVWTLLLVMQLSRIDKQWWLVALVAAMTLYAVPHFFKGLVIFRQRVEADGDGVRLRGLGGFDVPWSDVAVLGAAPTARSRNVTLVLKPERTVRSDLLLWSTRVRGIGVEADQVECLRRLAAAAGVPVSDSPVLSVREASAS